MTESPLITIRIPSPLKKLLDCYCREHNASQSEVVRQAIVALLSPPETKMPVYEQSESAWSHLQAPVTTKPSAGWCPETIAAYEQKMKRNR